jgi:CHAT domain-containing protein
MFDAGQRLLLDAGRRRVTSDYLKAVAEFENSRDLFEQLGDAAEASAAENWAAQILPDVGKLAEGRRRLAALIETAERRGFKALLPSAYYWLGVTDFRRGSLSQTGRSYRAALRLAEAGGNTLEAEHAREALALYYSDLGELEPALAYAGKLLPAGELYYRSPRQAWRNVGTLSDLALKLNLPATSLSFALERLDVAAEISPSSSLVEWSLRNVVNAADAKGDFGSALRYAGESLRLALARGDTPENTRTTAELYLSLADVRSHARDCEGALEDYARALELYGRLPELSVSSYQIRRGRLLCFQQLGRRDEFRRELDAVLKLSEAYRAAIREDSSRQAFFAEEQDVFDAATADALAQHDGRRAFALVEESRARSLLEFVQSDKSISEVEADFASVARPLSPEEVRAGLPEQVQLVQYSVLPDRLAVWVLTRSRFDFFERPLAAAELEKKVEAYRAALLSKEPAQDLRRAARELYELLIPPGLEAGKQLCLVPDKSLHQLAFASLVSPEGRYLLEEFALFYAPSSSVLVLASRAARRKEGAADESILSVGNPDFDREEHADLAGLQSAEAEAKAIAAFYGKSLALLGGDATKEEFLRRFDGAQVVHFAGHFLANPRSPGNSRMLFAGGDLRASELGTHKLRLARLVVLSACETAFERYDRSEGAIGIARTFLALGAPVVLASQWKVDSEPTKELMVAFHRNRREAGLSSAESLRRAQLEMLGRAATAEPFYWAAFSLFGGYARY